jgi:hypothetical protein
MMRAAFTLAVFVSAGLLFIVEPMFGKMVLPLLGGSPAVWTTCMLFFQGALLLGYVYAHVGPQWMGARRHLVLHLALLALAFLLLPLGITEPFVELREEHPTLWLLGVLTLSLGVPFILLSSTGPLLQVWFSKTSDPEAHNPYFLYAASNAGSLLALMSYPFLLEPTISLSGQAQLWSWGYFLLVGLVAVSAMYSGARVGGRERVNVTADPAPPVTISTKVRWTMLAFVPSSFLLALTTYVTTDVAAVPLLWILPLVLYLLSFTMVFARRPVVSQAALVRWQPIGLILLAVLAFWGNSASAPWLLPLHLIVFFVTALVCHGELAATKPAAARLTEFYLCIAVGGLLGGVFNALIAPAVFESVLEYPITLLIAAALRPESPDKVAGRSGRWDFALIGFACVVLLATRLASADRPITAAAILASGAAAVICLRMSRDRARFTLAIGGVVLAGVVADAARRNVLLRERNFFGVREVREDIPKRIRILMHGTTRHGAQSLEPGKRQDPLSYYNRQGPLGDVFHAFPSATGRRIAVVGLGAGTMAAYSGADERWTFFEIDPDIARLAQDTTFFTYLQDAPAAFEIILGDGRLSLGQAPDDQFDLIVLDAFSSDAIPTHLLTREALRVYQNKLTDDGVLVFHLSNRYLDLEPVLGRLVEDAGAAGLIRVNTARNKELLDSDGDPSIWAAVAPRASSLAQLRHDKRWQPLRGQSGVGLWTDDFTNIFRVFRRPGIQEND